MENRVYYGEYSLDHWITLLLKSNIKLPWYQRTFVWEKEQIRSLITTLTEDQFVPPVIIGAVKKGDEWNNYILDGQQRLTSILFAKINKYIDKKEYLGTLGQTSTQRIADDMDEDEDSSDEEIKVINWRYGDVIQNGEILEEALKQPYFKKLLDTPKDESFFKSHYLGFAFIKPSPSVSDDKQSKFYSDVFRSINTAGSKLTRLEVRRSLYFLKENLKDFFSPEFLSNYKVSTSSKESGVIDFIKYLSILAQHKNVGQLMRYGGRKWEQNEEYYKQYISAVVKHEENSIYNFFIDYPIDPYTNDRMEKLKKVIEDLRMPKDYKSIIDMDMYFFGLVYEIIFLGEEIDVSIKDELFSALEEKISQLREQDRHKYNPNALKYLRERISASIRIYGQFKRT